MIKVSIRKVNITETLNEKEVYVNINQLIWKTLHRD